MNKPFTIGITGGSGSGKTYFLKGLSAHFKPEEICLISQDNYYRPIDQQQTDENGVINFDLPDAFDRGAFYDDLLKLKSGQAVIKKEYIFDNTGTLKRGPAKFFEFKPAPILVVEGLFVQYFEEIEKELDLKIFIEAKDYIKIGRRIRRDHAERGSDVDDVLYRYQHHVMPVFETLIEPIKHKADLVIPNNANFYRALEVLVGYLKSVIG
ncbi:MAG: uridine kinase [Bacteroidia bacterium]|nr:uridine kinase [Bacteroidia bacterium]